MPRSTQCWQRRVEKRELVALSTLKADEAKEKASRTYLDWHREVGYAWIQQPIWTRLVSWHLARAAERIGVDEARSCSLLTKKVSMSLSGLCVR
jgi:hypothetical protein